LNKNKKYETFDHTADFGIKVVGKDRKALFLNAKDALYDILTNDITIKNESEETLEIDSMDQEMLLHDFLAELLYLFWVEKKIFTDMEIISMSDKKLKIKARTIIFNEQKTEINREIKAITYHQFEVGEENNKMFAKFVFDI